MKRLYLEKFLDNYNYIILIVFFVSFFLVVIHISAQISKRKKDIAFNKFYYKQQDSLFQDEEALKILEKLYAIHPKAGWLHIYNQKVQLLEQYGLITASGSFEIDDLHDPTYPYILRPIAEVRLKKMHSNS